MLRMPDDRTQSARHRQGLTSYAPHPAGAGTGANHHAKRCTSHPSVCLRPAPFALHSPPLDEDGAVSGANTAVLEPPLAGPVYQKGTLTPPGRRHDTEGDENLAEWFKRTNQNVSGSQSGLFLDGGFAHPLHGVVVVVVVVVVDPS